MEIDHARFRLGMILSALLICSSLFVYFPRLEIFLFLAGIILFFSLFILEVNME